MSNRLTSGTFYESDMLNHFIITKVTLFRGKEEGWGEKGLKGVNIVHPPPPSLHQLSCPSEHGQLIS